MGMHFEMTAQVSTCVQAKVTCTTARTKRLIVGLALVAVAVGCSFIHIPSVVFVLYNVALFVVLPLDWIEQGLKSYQTHYRSLGDGFLWVKRPNRQCQSTEGRQVLRIRLQSHQVHPTVLAIIRNKNTQNTHKHK